MTDWKNIRDSPPKLDETVDVWVESRDGKYPAIRVPDVQRTEDGWWNTGSGVFISDCFFKVTFWMPRPSPPEQE